MRCKIYTSMYSLYLFTKKHIGSNLAVASVKTDGGVLETDNELVFGHNYGGD